MESPTFDIPLTCLRDILNDQALFNKLTNMNANFPIPAQPFLEILKDPTEFSFLFGNPAFREQMQSEAHLVSDMLRDKQISKNIQDYEDGLWTELWKVVSKEETEGRRANKNDSRESITSQPNVLFQASSSRGEARCKVGDASIGTGMPMSVTSESEYGQAETHLGKLSIREDHSTSAARVVLSSKSKTGNATTNVDSVDLGDSYSGIIKSCSSTRSGIAISGHNSIGKGVHFTGNETHTSVLKTKAVTQSRGKTPEAKTSVEEKPSLVSGAISTGGSALYTSKKMNIELEDSDQQVLAFAESRDNLAVMSVDEVNIKVSKPQPVYKEYRVENLVGSLNIDNTYTSSFANCQGNMKAAETIVSQVPEDKGSSSTKTTSGMVQDEPCKPPRNRNA